MNKRLRAYFQLNGISMEEAANKIGYSETYLNKYILTRSDWTDNQRGMIIRAYPDTAAFVLPDWLTVEMMKSRIEAIEVSDETKGH